MLKKLFELLIPRIDKISKSVDLDSNQIDLCDFEKSPVRFEYEAILEDYRVITSEIRSRESHIVQVTNFALLLLGGFLAFMEMAKGSLTFLDTLISVRAVLPFVSILFSVLAFMQLHQGIMIAHLGKYCDTQLRPRMKEFIRLTSGQSTDIWLWNQFKSSSREKNLATPVRFMLGSANYLVTIVPGIALIIVWFFFVNSGIAIAVWEAIALSIAALMSILVLVTSVQHGLIFRDLAKKQ